MSSLTVRAFANAAAAFVQYGTRLLVTLVTAPVLIAHFGAPVYGTWQMLLRLGEHLLMADGRPTEALKWQTAKWNRERQGELPLFVGATVGVWLCFLPLFLMTAAALVWAMPQIVSLPPELHFQVRVAAALVFLATAVDACKSLPGSVLFGLNLGYRGIGLMAFAMLLCGVLMIIAVHARLPLPSIAAAHLAGAVLGALLTFWVVRRCVAQWGIAKPSWAQVRANAKTSVWFAAWHAVEAGLCYADLVILGLVLGVTQVATYVITSYAVQPIAAVILMALSALAPGISVAMGQNARLKAEGLRHESMRYLALAAVAVCVTVILWNESFVTLWVGAERFAGHTETLLIALATIQLTLLRADASIVNLSIDVREKVCVGALWMVVTVVLAALLATRFGIAGLCIGLLLGRGAVSVHYARLAQRALGAAPESSWIGARLAVAGAVSLAGAYVAAPHVQVHSWWMLLAAAGATFVVTATVLTIGALSADQREQAVSRLATVIDRLRPQHAL